MLFIKNGKIKTMTGVEYKKGCILSSDEGKIVAIGENIECPDGATVINANGKLVTPGIIEAHCHVGMNTTAQRWEGNEVNETTSPITPAVRAIDGFYPQDERLDDARRGGITVINTGPGSANVVGGTFTAFKTYGSVPDQMAIKNPSAMKCALGENPKSVYGEKGKAPKTRMQNVLMLRELLYKAKRYLADKEDGKNPAIDINLEAMLPVIKKEIPIKVHAHKINDILSAIRVAQEFDINLTLDHCTDGYLIADELLKYDYPIVIGPSFGSKSKPELANKGFHAPGLLNKAGLNICITTDASITPIETLPLCAGLAVSKGLAEDEAWKAITINPAKVIGVADRVGSLEVGKDADIVIWNNNPLRIVGAEPLYTIIDGKVVYKA